MVCLLHLIGADLDISDEKGQVATKVLLKMIEKKKIIFDRFGKLTKAYINHILSLG